MQKILFENLTIYTKLGSKILKNGFGKKFDGILVVLKVHEPVTKQCKSFDTAQILILTGI